MLKKILGEPNHNNKEILIEFEEISFNQNGYLIEDINPNNKIGIPNFLLKVGCIFDDTNIIDSELLVSRTSEGLDGIFAFDEFPSKINAAFINKFEGKYKVAASYLLLSNVFKDEVDFFIYLKDLPSVKIFEELDDAIDVIKHNKDYRNSAKDVFGTGTLCPAQEAILEKTFNLQPSFVGKKLKIVDTHNLYHLNFHGMGDLRNSKDEPVAVIKGLITFLSGLKKEDFDYIIFASEGKNGIRYKIFDEYKGTRPPTPEELTSQIDICNKLTRKAGFKVISEEGFEGDDVIGAYTRFFLKYGGTVEIISSDKDMYQLINPNDDSVKIWDPYNRKYIGEADWMKKFEVSPDKILSSLAIQGDTSDNVPGIKGVGKVGAAKLIAQFGDIEGIINGASSLPENKLKEKVLANFDNLRMSLKLVTLYDCIANEADFNEFKFPSYNYLYLIQDDLEELEINI